MYESSLYEEEAKKFPARGSQVEVKETGIKGICLSFNIMNSNVTIKTQENDIYRITLDQLSFKTHWHKEAQDSYRNKR